MNKEMSVLALVVKNNFLKVLALIVLMVVVEGFLFYSFMEASPNELLAAPETVLDAGNMIDKVSFSLVFAVTLILVFLVLCITEHRMDKHSDNTLRRLRISAKRFFVIKTSYNVFCMVLLFMVQVWMAIVAINIYKEHISEVAVDPQYLFIGFYRNKFLHNIFPMAEVGKWIRNIFMFTAAAMQAASCARKNSAKSGFVSISVANIYFAGYMVLVIMTSKLGISLGDMVCDIFSIIVIAIEVLKVYGISLSEDED